MHLLRIIFSISLITISDAKMDSYQNSGSSEELVLPITDEKTTSTTYRSRANWPRKGEAVVEKFIETLMSSEKYLKLVETVERKLNHLDDIFHEKTTNIMKSLAEITKILRVTPDIEGRLRSIENGLTSSLRGAWNEIPHGRSNGMDETLDTRLARVENVVKTTAVGVDSIISIISEVKNRQYSPPSTKSDSADTLSLISEFRRTIQEQKSKKCDCKSGRVDRSERYPLDCYEIQMQGFNVSGIFKIHPEGTEPFYVLCDLTTAGGGWTVFQNRFDGSQDFYRSWSDYKHGFGNLAGEFWLGLEKLHYLTNQKLYEVRVELESQAGHDAYAAYSVLTIGPEYEGYRISTLGTYYGTAGDSLSYHAGQKFSAFDMDNDEWKDGSCAVEHGGAWWYKECDKSNLNGIYVSPDEHRSQTVYWISFKGPSLPLTRTKMMIRPLPARRPIDYHSAGRKHVDLKAEPMVKHVKSASPKSKSHRPDNYRFGHPTAGNSFIDTYA